MKTLSVKILLVEDDYDDIQYFSDTLYRLSTSVFLTTIQDGNTAYQLLKSQECSPDYIFLDLNLPILDGVALLRKMRDDSSILNVPIIVHTASVNKAHLDECKELGISRFVAKSVDGIQLTKTLKECLGISY
jgi:CheY-like chemotaxis protein